jgi:ribosomal protein L23
LCIEGWGENVKKLALGLCSLLIFAGVSAAEQTPAFLHPDVLKAAVAINLTDAQKPKFQAALTEFMSARIEAVNRLIRKNNQTNLERKIKRKTNGLLKKMDAAMAEFLDDEQLPAYQHYRETLKANMRGM